jgi:hypothetical protein
MWSGGLAMNKWLSGAPPVIDKIEEDPLNVELIVAIRELKANTEPSPGAEACAP